MLKDNITWVLREVLTRFLGNYNISVLERRKKLR